MEDFSQIRITGIESVMTVKNEKGVNRIMRDRFAFALGFCRSGKLTYVHKTTKYVSERTVAVIIPKGKTYSLHCDESGEFPLINFQCVGFNPPSFTVIPLSDPAAYLSMFERIASYRIGEKNEFASLGAFYEILSMLSREGGNVKTIGAIQPAVDYLAVNFCSPGLTCAYLARLCFTSEAYFRRLFNARFGTSPAKYIKSLRIGKAKNLLASAAYSVTQIAEKCGYSSVYYFCQDFKTETGETPSAYRKRTGEWSY